MLTNQFLTCPLGGFKLFEASVNSNPSLYVSVILFNTIIKVFTPPNFDIFIAEIIAIDRPIKIPVFTSHLNIGFIHPPTSTNSIFSLVHRCLNHRSVLKHPSLNSRMINLDTSNVHQLFNVTIGESKSKLKVNSLKNYEFRISVVLKHRK
jgi:hypothetical protein